MTIWDIDYGTRSRVLIDTDAKNEADDQFAIVHALLSPSLDIRGLIAAHFGNRGGPGGMEESRAEIDRLVKLLDLEGHVQVVNGSPHALPDERTPIGSPGARLIIEEAMKQDAAPLFVAFLGPITDMACALMLEPRIVEQDVTVIWIGGPPYEGIGTVYKPEFNLSNDVVAANVVFASSLNVWQIPMSTYVMMAVGYAELFEKITPCGEIGRYLVRQLVDFNDKHAHAGRVLDFRSLGDSPAVGLMLDPAAGSWVERPAPGFNNDCTYDYSRQHRPIRVYQTIDSRYVLSDMFAKLRAYTAQKKPGRRSGGG
jgi:inosine-uridine nucleoside N-ribohydrolase